MPDRRRHWTITPDAGPWTSECISGGTSSRQLPAQSTSWSCTEYCGEGIHRPCRNVCGCSLVRAVVDGNPAAMNSKSTTIPALGAYRMWYEEQWDASEDQALFLLQIRYQRQEYGGRLIFLRILCSAHSILNTSRGLLCLQRPRDAGSLLAQPAEITTKHISRGANARYAASTRSCNQQPSDPAPSVRSRSGSLFDVVCPPIHLRRPHGEPLQDVKRSPDLASAAG